jgi:hypothetical protein
MTRSPLTKGVRWVRGGDRFSVVVFAVWAGAILLALGILD